MPREEPTELFHYTNSAGLKGILESQTLWATHYLYLNDTGEMKNFKSYLKELILSAVEQRSRERGIDLNTKEKKTREAKLSEYVEDCYRKLFGDKLNLPFIEPYITSFCTTKDDNVAKHGLLSQWRGYGRDGGYAIVFDACALKKLVDEENNKWDYCPLDGGDVVYSTDTEKEIQLKTDNHEKLKEAFINFLEKPTMELHEETYVPTVRSACRFKHWGFREEKEFRIVAVRSLQSTSLKKKPIKHFLRSNAVIPYLNLFEGITSSAKPLPIKRIIIGPHQEKEKRKRELKILINHLGIQNVKVCMSEIPYLGQGAS